MDLLSYQRDFFSQLREKNIFYMSLFVRQAIKLSGIRVLKVYILRCVILGIHENSFRKTGIQVSKIYLMMKSIRKVFSVGEQSVQTLKNKIFSHTSKLWKTID